MRAVAPVEMPLATAMMRKNRGKERETAATAWVERRPAYQVSTTLNMVLKKKPMPTGRARRRTSGATGSDRRSGCKPLHLLRQLISRSFKILQAQSQILLPLPHLVVELVIVADNQFGHERLHFPPLQVS